MTIVLAYLAFVVAVAVIIAKHMHVRHSRAKLLRELKADIAGVNLSERWPKRRAF